MCNEDAKAAELSIAGCVLWSLVLHELNQDFCLTFNGAAEATW